MSSDTDQDSSQARSDFRHQNRPEVENSESTGQTSSQKRSSVLKRQRSSPGEAAVSTQVTSRAIKRLRRSASYSGSSSRDEASRLAQSSDLQDSSTGQTAAFHLTSSSAATGHNVGANVTSAVNSGAKSLSANGQQVVESWKTYTKSWFPRLQETAYFTPHVFMHRVKRDTVKVSGVDVSVPQPPVNVQPKGSKPTLLTCYVRDDRAQQHVLHCLQAIADGRLPSGRKEVMFVLSQLNFGDYLNHPCFTAAARLFPRPSDLKPQTLDRGDFDILIIHRLYGLIVGEIKSFGEKASELNWSDDDFDNELLKKLRTMMKLDKKPVGAGKVSGQLMKAREVLQHLTKDRPSSPRIRATLILPNVTTGQLRRALGKDGITREALCKDLNLLSSADPVDVCLCSDQMSAGSSPWALTPGVLQDLAGWWRHCVCQETLDTAMNDDVYEDLVARFAGPASVVQLYCATEPRLKAVDIRTEEQAIDEVHRRLTQLALFPAQINILHENIDLKFLTGPPGTGKSVMLVLKSVEWLRQGRLVFVVSLDWRSHAASHCIFHQVEQTVSETLAKADPGVTRRVHLQLFDTKRLAADFLIEEAVNTLLTAAADSELNIILDEADGKMLETFYTTLKSSGTSQTVISLRIWAASFTAQDVPEDFAITTLTDPLRCPPTVVREVGQALRIQSGQVPAYTCPEVPPMMDGPPVIVLTHTQGQGGHAFPLIHDCEDCGMEIGRVLTTRLSVGKTKDVIPPAVSRSKPDPPIRYRDVMVLTFFNLRDDKRDVTGNVTTPADGLVRGVRKAGLPVTVLEEGDDDTVAMVAKMAGRDAVTMTSVRNVYGLERKVVVWVGRKIEGDDFGGRLHAMSRSTSQLIWIVR